MVLGGVKAAWLLVCAAVLGAREDTTGKAEVTDPVCLLVLSRKGVDLSWWMLLWSNQPSCIMWRLLP